MRSRNRDNTHFLNLTQAGCGWRRVANHSALAKLYYCQLLQMSQCAFHSILSPFKSIVLIVRASSQLSRLLSDGIDASSYCTGELVTGWSCLARICIFPPTQHAKGSTQSLRPRSIPPPNIIKSTPRPVLKTQQPLQSS